MDRVKTDRTKRELELLTTDLVDHFELEAYDFDEEHVRGVLRMVNEMAEYTIEYENQLREYIAQLEIEHDVENPATLKAKKHKYKSRINNNNNQ